MRVCVVVHQFPVRSETFVVHHVRELRARGHDVVVIPLVPRAVDAWDYPHEVAEVVAATAPRPPTLAPSGLRRVRQVVGLAGRSVLGGGRLWRLARDPEIDTPGDVGRRLLFADRAAAFGAPDVVHAHFAGTASAAVALVRHGIVDAPVVCSIHGTDATADDARAFAVANDVALYTVGSQFMRRVVEGRGVPASKIHVWPQGVDTTRPLPDRSAHAGLHVISVGRLVPVKGVADALRVVAMARPWVHGLRYTVVGDGPERAHLEHLAVQLGIADITCFTGALDHDAVLDAYATADVFLQMGVIAPTGAQEGQGLAAAEAACSGLPCIVTSAGGLAETVLDGETGWVVDIGDVVAAAEQLRRCATEPQLMRDFGRRGRARVHDDLSLDRSIARIESLYAQARRGP